MTSDPGELGGGEEEDEEDEKVNISASTASVFFRGTFTHSFYYISLFLFTKIDINFW